eukprot:4659817-Amphidinium_carterae.1
MAQLRDSELSCVITDMADHDCRKMWLSFFSKRIGMLKCLGMLRVSGRKRTQDAQVASRSPPPVSKTPGSDRPAAIARRTLSTGSVRYCLFDKTGTLTTEKLEAVGVQETGQAKLTPMAQALLQFGLQPPPGPEPQQKDRSWD